MSDPKEALERLTVEHIESLRWIADHQPPDARGLIHRLIAEREGLEREVARLNGGFAPDGQTWREFGLAQAEMRGIAESKLSALEEFARGPAAQTSPGLSALVEAVQDTVNARDDADHALPDHLREPLIQALYALSVAPPSQGMEMVPQAALEWLFGLGDSFEPRPGQRGNFWWRTEFRRRIDEALQSHKGGEGDSELAAADNNHKADCTTSGGAG